MKVYIFFLIVLSLFTRSKSQNNSRSLRWWMGEPCLNSKTCSSGICRIFPRENKGKCSNYCVQSNNCDIGLVCVDSLDENNCVELECKSTKECMDKTLHNDAFCNSDNKCQVSSISNKVCGAYEKKCLKGFECKNYLCVEIPKCNKQSDAYAFGKACDDGLFTDVHKKKISSERDPLCGNLTNKRGKWIRYECPSGKTCPDSFEIIAKCR